MQSGSAIHDLRLIELAELAEIALRMRACHSTWPQVVYGTVHMDWKLQNNHEKCRKNRMKQFYRNLIVGNLEKLAKNRQVCLICHINVNRSQETGNRQTKYCNPRAHARRALNI